MTIARIAFLLLVSCSRGRIDLQPCGGTHVRNIAKICGIRVIRVRNEGKRNKRVEITLTA